MVIAYILSVALGIAVGSLALTVALWIMDDRASLSDFSGDLKTCVLYNVIMEIVGVAVYGVVLGTGSAILAIIGVVIYISLAFKLLTDWFDLGRLSVIILMLIAGSINYLALTTAYALILGLLTPLSAPLTSQL